MKTKLTFLHADNKSENFQNAYEILSFLQNMIGFVKLQPDTGIVAKFQKMRGDFSRQISQRFI